MVTGRLKRPPAKRCTNRMRAPSPAASIQMIAMLPRASEAIYGSELPKVGDSTEWSGTA
jgi:hypothetical protein